jgi:COP9 signalosome complex subunit 1
MDLDALVSRYSGEACLQRLLFIANACSTTDLTLVRSARQHAVAIMKQTNNTHRFTQTVSSSDMSREDAAWLQRAHAEQTQRCETLTSRLHTAQAHLHKDAIRTAYSDLALFHLDTGALEDARTNAMRAKDYCVNRQQTAAATLVAVQVLLLLGAYADARDYLTKLTHTVASDDPAAQQVAVAAAVEALATGQLQMSYNHWQQRQTSSTSSGSTSYSLLSSWPQVVASREAALYAGVLTLAFGTRDEMMRLAHDAEALEPVPALRECLLQFARCNYGASWNVLVQNNNTSNNSSISLWDALKLDLYMAPHLDTLQTLIREKAAFDYWVPCRRVALSVMARDLGPDLLPPTTTGTSKQQQESSLSSSETTLVHLLVHAIGAQRLPDTRLDLQTRTLVRDDTTQADRLEATESRLFQLSERVLNDAYSMVIRMACTEYSLTVDNGSGGAKTNQKTTGLPEYEVEAAAGRGQEIEDDVLSDEDIDAAMVDVDDEMNPEDLY